MNQEQFNEAVTHTTFVKIVAKMWAPDVFYPVEVSEGEEEVAPVLATPKHWDLEVNLLGPIGGYSGGFYVAGDVLGEDAKVEDFVTYIKGAYGNPNHDWALWPEGVN